MKQRPKESQQASKERAERRTCKFSLRSSSSITLVGIVLRVNCIEPGREQFTRVEGRDISALISDHRGRASVVKPSPVFPSTDETTLALVKYKALEFNRGLTGIDSLVFDEIKAWHMSQPICPCLNDVQRKWGQRGEIASDSRKDFTRGITKFRSSDALLQWLDMKDDLLYNFEFHQRRISFVERMRPDSEQITNVETLAAKPRGWDFFQFTELIKEKLLFSAS
ncbi:ATP-dependent protease ATPase subunit HslU [Striga asiatica]|uniref:ATP-dependent protease ATPase subunit HslU n=1 Tax=Striga asiatica TaxID=4170 RepID=A0A5A7Q274_STRAF|nr:ATP-dependent protease ATPase subunit HslU [Striga asiatica]